MEIQKPAQPLWKSHWKSIIHSLIDRLNPQQPLDFYPPRKHNDTIIYSRSLVAATGQLITKATRCSFQPGCSSIFAADVAFSSNFFLPSYFSQTETAARISAPPALFVSPGPWMQLWKREPTCLEEQTPGVTSDPAQAFTDYFVTWIVDLSPTCRDTWLQQRSIALTSVLLLLTGAGGENVLYFMIIRLLRGDEREPKSSNF